MGKKTSQVSVNKSKKNIEKKKKQQLNSLIKVLKPKVYITDSSSFKILVQELTGNGSISSSPLSSPSPSPSPSPSSPPPPPVMNHVGSEISSCSSMEAFSDTSLDSFEPCSNNSYEQMLMEETATSVEYLMMNQQQTDLLFGYHHQDLDLEESLLLLLDMEEPPTATVYSSCNNNIVSAPQIQHEVSIYDYELLPGLI